MNKFSDRVKDSRERLKLTQKALAEACGLKQSTISSYEGQQRVKTQHLIDLARALKVNPEWLQHGKGPRDAESAGYAARAPSGGFHGLKDSALEREGRADAAMIGNWPFPRITREHYALLSPEERVTLEDMALLILKGKRASQTPTPPTTAKSDKPARAAGRRRPTGPTKQK